MRCGCLRVVSGMVILDLKVQEVVDGFERFGICALDENPRAGGQLFEGVRNLSAFFFHDRDTRWDFVMDEHGDGEVALRK